MTVAHLEQLVNSSLDGILAFDREYRLTVWNPALERLFDISQDRALGQRAFDLLPFLQESGEDKFFAEALAGKTAISECRPYTIPKTGRPGFFEARYSPLRDEAGEIVGGMAIIRDVTRQQLEVEYVRQNEARNQALLDAIPDLVLRIHRDGTYLDFKAAREFETVVPPDEFLGKTEYEVMPAELAKQRMRHIEQALETGQIQMFEYQISRQGQLRYEEARIIASGPDEVLVIIRDVTERKQAEVEIAQHNRELMALQYAAATVTSELDLQRVLNTVTKEMTNLLDVAACAISRWDQGEDTLSLMAEYGPEDWWSEGSLQETFTLADFPLTKRVLVERRPEQLTVGQPDINPAELAYMQQAGLKSLLMLPMEFQNQVVGLVEIMDDRLERVFSPAEIGLAQMLANQAAATLEKARLYDQAQQELAERQRAEAAEREQRELAEALYEVAVALNTTLNLDELLQRILTNVGRVVPHNTADIMLLEAGVAHVAENRGYIERGQSPVTGLAFSLDELPTLRQMAETGQPLVIPNTRLDPLWADIPHTRWVRSYVGAPIHLRGEVVGFINLASDTADFFTPAHANRLQAFAYQAGVAIENARLLEAEREQRLLAETLSRVGQALSAVLNLPDLLDLICQESIRLFAVDSALVWLVQDDELVGFAGYGPQREQFIGRRVPLSDPLTLACRVIREKQAIFVNDALHSDEVNIELMKLYQVRAILGVPLIKGEQAVGALMIVDSRQPQRFGPADAETAMVLGNYAAIAIENARLYAQAQQEIAERERAEAAEREQRKLAERLRDATAALISAFDLEDVLDSILIHLEQVVPYDSACVFLLEGDRLHVVAGRGYPNLEAIVGRDFPATESLMHEEFHQPTGRPLILADARADSRFRPWGGIDYVRGWMGVPLLVRGKFIGYLSLDSKQVAAFDQAEVALAQAFANQAAVAIDNARLFEQTQTSLAQTDALYRVTQALIAFENLPNLLQVVADRVAEALPATWVALVTLNMAARQITDLVVSGPEVNVTRTGMFDELMDGLTGWVVRERKPALSLKGKPDPRESPQVQQHRAESGFGSVIVVPLQYQEEILGTITAVNPLDKRDFTPQDVELMMAMANQAAIAIENNRLFAKTDRWAQHLTILNELAREMTGLLDVGDLCAIVTERLWASFGYYNVAIFTADPSARQLTLQANAGTYTNLKPGQYRQAFGAGIIGQVAESSQPLIVNDTRQHPGFFELEEMTIYSELAMPLKVGQQLLGVINIDSDQYNAFSDEDVSVLTIVADQLAVALEKARLFAETRRRAEQLEALRQVSQDLTVLHDLDTLLRQITERAIQLLGGEGGGIYLYRPEREVLEWTVAVGDASGSIGLTLERGEGLSGKVWETGEPLIVNDFQNWPGKSPQWSDVPRSAIGAPIQWGDEFLGVLALRTDNPHHHFKPEDASLLSQFATQAAIAIQNASLFATAQQRVSELEAIRQASLGLASSLDLQAVLEAILKGTLKLLSEAQNAHIFIYQDGRLTFGAALWHDGPRSQPVAPPRPHGLTYTVARQGRLIEVPNMQTHPLFADAPPAWQGAIIGLPLKIGQQLVGVMTIAYQQPGNRPGTELRVLQLLADQAAIAIQNARLYEQAQREISERKQAEQALRQSEAKNRALLSAIPDLLMRIHRDGTFLEIIPGAQIGTYVPIDQAVGKTVYEVLPAEIAQERMRYVQLALQSGQVEVFEFQLPIAGEPGDFEARMVASGQDEVLMIVRDITKRKRNEAELRAYREHLETLVKERTAELERAMAETAAARDRIDAILHSVADGLLVTDLDHRVILANPAAAQLLAVPLKEILGRKIGTGIKDNRLQEIVRNTLNRQTDGYEVDIELDDVDGQQYRVMRARTALVDDHQGQPLGTVTIIQDVTRLREVDRLKTELLTTAAHELRTPLTSIMGFSEILLARNLDETRQQRYLTMINQQSRHLANIIDDLLDVSRLESGRGLDLKLEPVDIARLMEGVVLPFAETASGHDIRLEGLAELPMIIGDPFRLAQVGRNLLSNAIKYSKQGGKILIRGQLIPGYLKISFQDEGIGMTPEQQAHLFEPFYRADTSHTAVGGAGLGLAICKLVVEQHGGKIWLESEPGQGTTVYFTLPLAQDQAMLEPEETAQTNK